MWSSYGWLDGATRTNAWSPRKDADEYTTDVMTLICDGLTVRLGQMRGAPAKSDAMTLICDGLTVRLE